MCMGDTQSRLHLLGQREQRTVYQGVLERGKEGAFDSKKLE